MPFYQKITIEETCFVAIWQLTESVEALLEQINFKVLQFYPEKWAALQHPQKKRQWLAVLCLLQQLFQSSENDNKTADPLLKYHPSGKPYLPQFPQHQISISHTSKWVVVAVNTQGGPIGVDVELISPKALNIAPRFCSHYELRLIREVEPSRLQATYATIFWTCKEAMYKLVGRKGLSFSENIRITLFSDPYPDDWAEMDGEVLIAETRQVFNCKLQYRLLEKDHFIAIATKA